MVFQFRKHQQGMLHLLFTSMSDALKNSAATEQERAEARRTLRGIFGTMTLAGGVLAGTPFVSDMLGLMTLLAGAGGDDDDPWDAKVAARNLVYDHLGKEAADVFAKGVFSLVGADMGARIGAGQIANPMPYVRTGGKPDEDFKEVVFSSLGAPMAMASRMWVGLNKIADGDVERGVADVVPLKMAKDLLRWHEMNTEGQRTSTGETRLQPTDFSAWDKTLRLMGVQPMTQSNYYDATAAIKKKAEAADTGHMGLIQDYAQAVLKRRPTREILKEIQAFNRRHPEKAITMKGLNRAVKERQRLRGQTNEAGVLVTKDDRAAAREGRFAGA
jgi:hypothetical protein